MKRRLESLVADIADDVSIDWTKLEGTSQPDELVREFRVIAAVGARRTSQPAPPKFWGVAIGLLKLAVTVAAVSLVVTTLSVVFGPSSRVGPRAALAVGFAVTGAFLGVGGSRDKRSQALGGLFILIGVSFARSYLVRALQSPLALPAALLLRVVPEVFLALAIWVFAWVFPSPPRGTLARQLGVWGIWGGVGVGLVLLVANVVGSIVLPSTMVVDGVGAVDLGLAVPEAVLWLALLAVGSFALPYLVWKSLAGTVDDRARVSFLAFGLVAGLAPIILAVVATPLIPVAKRPQILDAMAGWLYLTVGALVPATVYAVSVKKALDVHLVIRRAVQHALVRAVVGTAIVGCVLYVVASFWVGRDRSLAELLSREAGLLTLTSVGFVALTFRQQVLLAVDRWFERRDADYSAVMTHLASRLSGQRNMRDLHGVLEDELRHALHATSVVVVVVNDERTAFVNLHGTVRSLPMSSALVALFQQTRQELCLGGDSADPLVRLLPLTDRTWLAEARAEWVFPMFDSAESLLGLLCLGESGGPAYSRRDRVLVSAMADQVALRMENLSLRQWPADGGWERHGPAPVDWQNERAMRCPKCQYVRSAGTTVCNCGAQLEAATLPLVLNGKFRVERVLGAGGMSVVYLALDIALNRRVAIKTLPTATPSHVARLEREARAMASVLHPNLAMIYGAERWRDVPLLVVEYLEAGTLLDGLRGSAMTVDEVLGLGIELADALDRMHTSGLLHRDIKPSNIGYTAEGLPKLLDFGLAAMLDRVHDDLGRPVTLPTEAGALTAFLDASSPEVTRTVTQQLVGTPLYLSPEALAGHEPDASFDLWSLGMVLYQAIAGRHPLGGYPAIEAMRRTRSVRLPDVRDFRPDCPAQMAAFLNDALSLSFERRPATAAEFRAQLQSVRRALSPPGDTSRIPLY